MVFPLKVIVDLYQVQQFECNYADRGSMITGGIISRQSLTNLLEHALGGLGRCVTNRSIFISGCKEFTQL
jgi:hypothetical protein